MPKPKQPMRPPTAFERLADPREGIAPPIPSSPPTAPFAPDAPRSLCPLPPSRDTTSSYVSKKSPPSPNASSRKKKPSSFRKSSRASNVATVRVTYYDTYGYRARTGILDEVLPAFKLLKLKDIAIDFDDIKTSNCADEPSQGSASRAALTTS